MTDLVLHNDRSSGLVELARCRVADGAISEPETPALLRQVARKRLGAEIELRVVVVIAFPVFVPPKDDFALVEYEIRPGVRNYRLARVPRNDPWGIRIGAFERGMRRSFFLLARLLTGVLRGPASTAPASEPAHGFREDLESRAGLLPGLSRCSSLEARTSPFDRHLTAP